MKKSFNKDITLFCEQLAMILNSGLPLDDGIRAIAEEVEDREYQKVLETMANQLEGQQLFSDVLDSSGAFDQYMINMVRIGEESGYLDRVMEQLSVYYQRIDETREKVRDAISYPSILIVMMLAVIAVLVFEILPIFQDVLNNMGAEISSLALGLMEVGNIIAQYGLFILALMAIVIIYLVLTVSKGARNRSLMSILSSNMLTRRLGTDMSTAQFAYAMSLLMNSGYETEESLKMIPDMLDNKKLSEKIDDILNQMSKGVSFEEAIIKSKIFKGIYNRILIIGFKAGKAEETMAKIALEYEDEVNSMINRFLNVIEPTLVAFLSIVVGIVLLSVMLPLMSIMSTLG